MIRPSRYARRDDADKYEMDQRTTKEKAMKVFLRQVALLFDIITSRYQRGALGSRQASNQAAAVTI